VESRDGVMLESRGDTEGRDHREVDSSVWARRRGGQPHGRMDVKKGKRALASLEARTEKRKRSSRVNERPKVATDRKGNRP
jgi:hypothetical protein